MVRPNAHIQYDKSATEGGRIFPLEAKCIALERHWIDGSCALFIHGTSDKLPFIAACFIFSKRTALQIYLQQ